MAINQMKRGMLIKKASRVLREEGIGMLVRKTSLYLKNREFKYSSYSERDLIKRCYRDVLFINGCYLDAPTRYRVKHQKEQLEAGNLTCAEIFYKEISMEFVKNFRMFIFYRCPYTTEVEKFIKKAKEYNKTVLFDVDDLVIDTKYTDTIEYVQCMQPQERQVYDAGVDGIGKVLKMCDGAITTTEDLAEELKKYVSAVYINRNVVSDQMINISNKSYEENKIKKSNKVSIGYFSGSITHNPDFNMVLPALIRLMDKYAFVELTLVGEIDVPSSLAKYKERLNILQSMDWKMLPKEIAKVDINIAPLEDTIFNSAKSEVKWLEAALVKIPTVASDVGAFHIMIEDGKTGVLCKTIEEWYNKLEQLIINNDLRIQIGEAAYRYTCVKCSTVYTGAKFATLINKLMKPNIVFILPVLQISGGALVTLRHAAFLQEAGYDVTIFNDGYEKQEEIEANGCNLPVVLRKNTVIEGFIDKCVATLWTTTSFFNTYGKIGTRYYLIQNYETDFYQAGDNFKIEANKTYCMRMSVKSITISKWCQNWLREQYGVHARYAPNGLEIKTFYPVARDFSKKIRILVEGNSDDYYKNVDESFKIVNKLDREKYEVWYMSYQGKPKEWYRVDKFLHKVPYNDVGEVYRQCHILIKSSLLESFSYPPLEMMATGGCVVVSPNEGNIEYLEDMKNCLFYKSGDVDDAIRKIELLLNNRELRDKIIMRGIDTGKARAWDLVKTQVLELYS